MRGLLLIALSVTFAPSAYAQDEGPAYSRQRIVPHNERVDPDHAITVALMPLFGFAGGTQSESDVDDAVLVESGITWNTGLDTSYGFGAHVDFPLGKHFSLGPLVRFIDWSREGQRERAEFVDFALSPRLRAAFSLGAQRWGVAFLQMPLGFALAEYPDPRRSLEAGTFESSPAFMLGMMTGVQVFVFEHVGLQLELGWLMHAFETKLDGTIGRQGDEPGVHYDVDSDVTTGQLTLQLGLTVAL